MIKCFRVAYCLQILDLTFDFIDIISRVVTEREAECAAAMWKEVYREDPIRLVTQEMNSNLVPPPTPGTSVYATDDEEMEEIDNVDLRS